MKVIQVITLNTDAHFGPHSPLLKLPYWTHYFSSNKSNSEHRLTKKEGGG